MWKVIAESLHSSVSSVTRTRRLAVVGHRGVLMGLWPLPPFPLARTARIPFHVPVTNHHADLSLEKSS